MWINHRSKMIFLCNPKCFTTTVRKELEKVGFKRISRIFNRKYKNHMYHSTMYQVVDFLKTIGYNPYKFTYITFIRNPFTRLLSNFKYCKFDKDWNPKYGRKRNFALRSFRRPHHFEYKGRYKKYTINDYIMNGYNRTRMLCTHPLPLNDFLIFGKGFKIKIFKVEEIDYFFKKFHLNYLKIPKKNPSFESKKERNFYLKTLTKESIEKVKRIFFYEFKYYYTNTLSSALNAG